MLGATAGATPARGSWCAPSTGSRSSSIPRSGHRYSLCHGARRAIRARPGLAVLALAASGAAAPNAWEQRASLPVPRTEVAAAVVGNEIAVAGGFNADGSHSARVDVYSPSLDRWRRLPDLPASAHHAMAVGRGGRLYVLGGYGHAGNPLRTAYVLENGAWRALPRLPFPRAAAGAAVVGNRDRRRRRRRAGERRPAREERACLRPADAPLVGRARADASRAPRRRGARRQGLRRRGPNLRARHEPDPPRVVEAGRPPLATARARAGSSRRDGCGRESRGASSRSAARNRAGRSARSTRTGPPRAAGSGSRTCPRRGTGSGSSRSAVASSSSAAGRSRG